MTDASNQLIIDKSQYVRNGEWDIFNEKMMGATLGRLNLKMCIGHDCLDWVN